MAVGDYDIKPFAGPVSAPPASETVRGNDEVLRTKFVEHQADAVAHISAGLLASRPASADEGAVWVATDTGAVSISVYVSGAWVDAAYVPDTGEDLLATE